jgi:hypothetical protein
MEYAFEIYLAQLTGQLVSDKKEFEAQLFTDADLKNKWIRINKENYAPGFTYYINLTVSKTSAQNVWKDPVTIKLESPYGPYVYNPIDISAFLSAVGNNDKP